jgi:hypothetical protein
MINCTVHASTDAAVKQQQNGNNFSKDLYLLEALSPMPGAGNLFEIF